MIKKRPQHISPMSIPKELAAKNLNRHRHLRHLPFTVFNEDHGAVVVVFCRLTVFNHDIPVMLLRIQGSPKVAASAWKLWVQR